MKKISFILPLCALAMLASCNSEVATEEAPISSTVYTTTRESKLSYRSLSDKVNNYYKDADVTLRGEEFIDSLTPIISANYQKYGYDTAWDIIADADEDPYNSNNIVCIYTGLSIPKSGQGNTWNREHTWPKSHGFPSESNPAYTDCHHLTATQNAANNARGDLDFDEVSNYSVKEDEDGYGNKWIKNVCFEPRDEAKGDCARAIFYMMTRYNSSTLDLEVSDTIPTITSDGTGQIGKLSTLIKWHYQDPVSDEEIRRNEVIYSYQLNRNPFIDHPEWVNYLFGEDNTYIDLPTDEDKVLAIINYIEALPENVTLENEEEVYSIYNSVMELNAQEKLYINNYQKLSAAKYLIDYLKANKGDDDAAKTFDFTTATGAAAFTANVSVTVNEASFFASCVYISGGEFRLGTNGKKISDLNLSTIGATGSGHYLRAEFSTENLTGVTVSFLTTYETLNKCYLIGLANDEYTVLYSGAITENKFKATFDSFDGQFIFAIEGTNPRAAITTISIYTE